MTEQREREDRSTTVARERRRRDDIAEVKAQRLPIPPEVEARLKAEGRTPRWVNDERNQIYRLTVQDDYDPVEDVAPVPVGTENGKPILAHLLSKPTEFIAQDQAKREEQRREREQGLLKGKIARNPGEEPAPLTGHGGTEMYVTKDTKIGRGNQIID
jgi:hypothetical protein